MSVGYTNTYEDLRSTDPELEGGKAHALPGPVDVQGHKADGGVFGHAHREPVVAVVIIGADARRDAAAIDACRRAWEGSTLGGGVAAVDACRRAWEGLTLGRGAQGMGRLNWPQGTAQGQSARAHSARSDAHRMTELLLRRTKRRC